ncbi:hypothetical protein P43SY_005144 [Pythium insidiosum]|uniref:Ketoreductase domain-containing protein n=1 Tax=Pythium insidiosum TaxID=114742 RepID=A0AAD5Q6V8_PYTIN|nr:hypothetical protein P43SY_005144 [Pythium insidiosum]
MSALFSLSLWLAAWATVAMALLAIGSHVSRRLWQRPFVLDGKVIVITGAGSGIGRRLAEQLWRCTPRGVTLALLDVDEVALKAARSHLLELRAPEGSASVNVYECDVSDERAVAACIECVLADVAPRSIDVLVNNAGVVNGRTVEELTPAELQRVFAVNVFAHFWMAKHVLPSMKRSADAMIVSIASILAFGPAAKLADYCASKAAVASFHDSLRLELRREGVSHIRTLLVCPLGIRTGMFEGIFDGDQGLWGLQTVVAPLLSEDQVVRRIHRAMLNGEREVISCLDGAVGLVHAWTTPALRLLPVPIRDAFADAVGAVRGMDTFVGRSQKPRD